MAQKDHTREIEVTELGMLQSLEEMDRAIDDEEAAKKSDSAAHSENLKKYRKDRTKILQHLEGEDDGEGLRRELEASDRLIDDEEASRDADNDAHNKALAPIRKKRDEILGNLEKLRGGELLDFTDQVAEVAEEEGGEL